MAKGENFPPCFHLNGRASACLNDEQTRLVFKTPTWLKTFIHAWLSDSITFSRVFSPSTRY